ncbi:BURP domain protein RD22 [Quillaja saponaria]|uniref:BURP domain protein RD22 n=1 Tax=Quillaja saponaria TaxID=32244 RepID=A0AAD7PSZ2_QUISA|nr:BURP domain protein RD22 [Quillaja saponaria]
MEYHNLLPIVTFLTLAVVATHAALPPELYWKSKLPNTPIPKAIRDLLNPADFIEDKSTTVAVGKGGVNVNAGKGKPGNTAVNVGKGGVNVNAGKGKPDSGGGTHVSVGGKGGVGVNTGKPDRRTNVGVGKGGVSVSTGHKGKPVYVGVKPGPNPFIYNYAATETQLHDDPNVALFFLEKDLQPGTNLALHFTKSSNPATLLSRKAADSIPFSSNKLPEILDNFSVKSGSMEAEIMKNTVKECEDPSIKGEEKYCATSLESMVDYSTSKLGKNVEAISTEVGKETQLQKYTIAPGVKKMEGNKAVVCHKQNYAYAVFYCHKTETTRAYEVPLVGADGTKAEAVAICHTDTSEWNPKHLAFQALKVKPGTVPVCHFLPEDHVVWVSK